MSWETVAVVGGLLVRAGMAMQQAGLVRSKNSAGMFARHLVDLALCVLGFGVIGAGLALAEGGKVLAFDASLLAGGGQADLRVLGMLALAMPAGAIVHGAAAERTRLWPLVGVAAVLYAAVVPLLLFWTKGAGWLAEMGFRDVGALAAVHLAASVFALTLAVRVGPRQGKHNRDGSTNAIPGHSAPLAASGLFVLLAGWAVMMGSMGVSMLWLLFSASAAVLTALGLCHVRYGKPDVHLMSAAAFGGLVAASAGPSGALAALAGGVICGLGVPAAILIVDLTFRVDDPAGGVAVHGIGGLVGLILAGLIPAAGADRSWLMGAGIQILGVGVVLATAGVLGFGLVWLLGRAFPLRSREADEFDGLDLAEHDIGAYPDFQQTSIKSYHLREA